MQNESSNIATPQTAQKPIESSSLQTQHPVQPPSPTPSLTTAAGARASVAGGDAATQNRLASLADTAAAIGGIQDAEAVAAAVLAHALAASGPLSTAAVTNRRSAAPATLTPPMAAAEPPDQTVYVSVDDSSDEMLPLLSTHGALSARIPQDRPSASARPPATDAGEHSAEDPAAPERFGVLSETQVTAAAALIAALGMRHEDARDQVLLAVVKTFAMTGNRPSTPKELAAFILTHRLATLGNANVLNGKTPYATVSSRISQHIRRCANSGRRSIISKLPAATAAPASTAPRKWRYYIDPNDIPAAVHNLILDASKETGSQPHALSTSSTKPHNYAERNLFSKVAIESHSNVDANPSHRDAHQPPVNPKQASVVDPHKQKPKRKLKIHKKMEKTDHASLGQLGQLSPQVAPDAASVSSPLTNAAAQDDDEFIDIESLAPEDVQQSPNAHERQNSSFDASRHDASADPIDVGQEDNDLVVQARMLLLLSSSPTLMPVAASSSSPASISIHSSDKSDASPISANSSKKSKRKRSRDSESKVSAETSVNARKSKSVRVH